MIIKINFSNYEQLLFYEGAELVYASTERNELSSGKVEIDPGWNGGFKVNGRSIRDILENYDKVGLIVTSDDE